MEVDIPNAVHQQIVSSNDMKDAETTKITNTQMEETIVNQIQRIPVSFKDVITFSSQWFQEARQVLLNTMEWEDQEDVVSADLISSIRFNKEILSRLRNP